MILTMPQRGFALLLSRSRPCCNLNHSNRPSFSPPFSWQVLDGENVLVLLVFWRQLIERLSQCRLGLCTSLVI